MERYKTSQWMADLIEAGEELVAAAINIGRNINPRFPKADTCRIDQIGVVVARFDP